MSGDHAHYTYTDVQEDKTKSTTSKKNRSATAKNNTHCLIAFCMYVYVVKEVIGNVTRRIEG